MTIDKKEEKITPMYIVGTINDGKFKQAIHYGGHSGNRLFSRKRDAVNFYNQEKNEYPELEIHIYEITQVSDCTENIENDEKALENPEFPIIEYIKKWIEEYKVNEIYFHYDTWEDSNHNQKIMLVFENVKIGEDYLNSIKFKTNYTSTLEFPKELDSLSGLKMPVEEFKEKFLRWICFNRIMKTVEDLEKENEILKLKLRIAELEKELEQAKETIKEESKRPFIS